MKNGHCVKNCCDTLVFVKFLHYLTSFFLHASTSPSHPTPSNRINTRMSEDQSATSTTNPEAIALLEKHYHPSDFRKRKNAISGPTRSPIGKKDPYREKNSWPTSRFERARAPSPETPDWPTHFCLIMECDMSVPHGHTKKQIIERIGYASWKENLFEPAWSKADGSEEYDGLYRGRPSNMRGSSLLNPAGEGTNELREALPKINDAVKDKQADEQNISSSAIFAVTAGLNNLNIRTLDRAKSTKGSAARKE